MIVSFEKDNDGDKLKTDESEKNRTSFDNVQDVSEKENLIFLFVAIIFDFFSSFTQKKFYKRYNDLENEIHIQSDERFRYVSGSMNIFYDNQDLFFCLFFLVQKN